MLRLLLANGAITVFLTCGHFNTSIINNFMVSCFIDGKGKKIKHSEGAKKKLIWEESEQLFHMHEES